MLDCDLIAKIYDHSKTEDKFQYYVMEYYEQAVSLDEVIFSPSNVFHGDTLRSLNIFEQLIGAISVCEKSKPPIVHRDINPKNILLLPGNKIRLIDFGICQVQDGQIITLTDENVGTRNYTAPECEAGSDNGIGSFSDFYSAAKVLWSTITSQHAFAREEAVFKNKSLMSIFTNLSSTWHLNKIFAKSIRSNPQDRFKNTDQILLVINEIKFLVNHGYPSIEEVAERCPSCGQKGLVDFPQGHAVFGNPNPRGVQSIICRFCGFGFVRNMDLWRQNLDEFTELK